MNKCLINLHAHTIFSDGHDSPYLMAQKAKQLGLCCIVLTDHWYCSNHKSMTPDRFRLFRQLVREAEDVLPVIVGLEIPVEGDEILVFGEELIDMIVSEGNVKFSVSDLKTMKHRVQECAVILCHPRNPSLELIKLLDGYERGNSGQDWIMKRTEEFKDRLKHLPAWSNSDAHSADMLNLGYNMIDCMVTKEQELIRYIRSGKQPCMYLRDVKIKDI